MNVKVILEIIKNSLTDLYLRTGTVLSEEMKTTDGEKKDFFNLTEAAVRFFLQEKNKRERTRSVSSIFNHLNGNSEEKKWPAIKIMQSGQIEFPGREVKEWGEKDYIQMQEWLRKEIRTFREDNRWINAFLDELEEELLYVPDDLGNNEVSLYEHAKFAAAIGSCLSKYYGNADFSDLQIENVVNEPIFCLFSMDLSGIQDFIYTISSKGALKSLRARSFYLEIMMENMADELLEAADMTRANLIYSGGGHCYILFPNTEQVQSCIESYMEKMNRWFLERFQVDLYVGYGMAQCSLLELNNEPEGSYAEIFREVSSQISAKKMRRYSADQIRMLNSYQAGDGVRECKICKRTDHLDEEDYCEICGSLLSFSRNILSQEYFSVIRRKDEDSLPLPNDVYLVPKKLEDADRIYKKNGSDRNEHICTKIWLGDYAAADTFEEMADGAEGIKRLGIYRADVDNLGTAFVSGFNTASGKNRSSLIRTASLSRHLSLFFKFYINYILRGKNVAIVYSGGDDLFIVGGWNDVLHCSLELQEKLTLFSLKTLTISGGIGIYPESYPIHVMAQEAAELEDTSKAVPGKNAVTLFSDRNHFGWVELRKKVIGEKLGAIEEYFQATDEHGKNFLYNLLELLEDAREKKKDKISLVRYVYLLSRMEPEDRDNEKEREAYRKFSKSMYDWMQGAEDREQLITAIYIYVYKVRERAEEYGKI